MPSIQRSVLVPFSNAQMFDLVADVARYPEFMPWCGGADVQWQNDQGMQATVHIHFAGIRQSFTTRNDHEYPDKIVFHLVDGPFSNLTGHWQFLPLGEDGCKVLYTMDYAFSSRALSAVIGPVFNRIASSFIDSFTQRAHAVYGA
ncbi:type II toxin-antitoxin system RatA family toxin [Castellaniella sp. FW104-16D08]|uniref:type II toxin-antitoxin system RatA family toxin n=1 Tax=unclassified Castellaniella TaxID=2617606 RepID=UPI0033158CF7